MHKREIRRQIIHFIYGPILVFLFEKELLTLPILLGMIIGGAAMSLMIKRERLSPFKKVLSLFERDHHMINFPGKGVIFFTIGSFLALWLFEKHIAYAGILILSFGDGVANLVGRHYGKIKTKLNPDKYIEGTLIGILVSIPVAYYFVPNIAAAISASTIAMFLELPNIKLFNFEIDDNLLIPVGASFTLSLFM